MFNHSGNYEFQISRSMPNLNAKEYANFESIKHISEDGSEFWYVRDLASVLEYAQWRNFAKK